MRIFAALLLGSVCALQSLTAGNVPTAKRVADLAHARFQSGSQNQIIRLEGVDADSDLRPRQWDVTVFDPNRANKGTVIRLRDGVVVSVAGAVRMFDDARWSKFDRNFSGYDVGEVINPARWKLDSTDAVTKIGALPGMTNIQLVDVRMTLVKLSDGDVPPVWRVKVRGRSRVVPSREAWIGAVSFSAETGEVLKNDLRPERLVK
jgi:hypothetical protein